MVGVNQHEAVNGNRVSIARSAVCNSVQRIALEAALNGRDWRRRMKLDRDFRASAAIGFNSCQLEGLALARAWGFESPLPHQ